MKIVLQRVTRASVSVGGEEVGAIDSGILALVGFGHMDDETLPKLIIWRTMLKKLLELRIFPDEKGKMNLSLAQFGGQLLLVSQFTLYADCRKGRRPSFTPAAKPELAERLFDRFVADAQDALGAPVPTGRFGEEMEIDLVNWGPVTITLDSKDFAR